MLTCDDALESGFSLPTQQDKKNFETLPTALSPITFSASVDFRCGFFAADFSVNSSVDFSVDFCRGFFRGFFSSYFEIFETQFFHFFFHGVFHTLFHGGFPRWNIETDSELSFLKIQLPTRNTPRPCFPLAPLPRRCHPQKLRDKSHVYCCTKLHFFQKNRPGQPLM